MILQRDIPLKIWGWSAANESITVSFLNKEYSAQADKNGNWMITLPKQKAGGPYAMKLKASNEINLADILIGDVWVCSGQSNMELWMDRIKYKYASEIANANNAAIRQFLVPDKYNFQSPQIDVEAGSWLPVTPKNIGEFSGVAYFFAKEINAKYNIPIGLINAALGGSPAEAWISEEALKKFPVYNNETQTFKDNSLIKKIESRDQQISNTWYSYINEFDEGHRKNWQLPETDDKDWKTMNIPGYWADAGEESFNGVVWFRKEIIVPASMADKSAKLELGRVVDADSVFVNGTLNDFEFEKVELTDKAIIAFITTSGKMNIRIDGME